MNSVTEYISTLAIKPLPAIAFVGKQNSGKTTLLVAVIAELSARGVRVGSVKHHSHTGFDFDKEGKDSWRHAQAGSRYTVVCAPDKLGSVRRLTEEMPVERIIADMSAAACCCSLPDGDAGAAAADGVAEIRADAAGGGVADTQVADDSVAAAADGEDAAGDVDVGRTGDVLACDDDNNKQASDLDIILVEGYRKSTLPTIELFRAANPNDAGRELGGEGNDIVAVVTDIERIAVAAAKRGIPSFAFDEIADIANFVLKFCSVRA